MKNWIRGFTLAEVLLVSLMIPAVIAMLFFMFQAVTDSWTMQGTRAGLSVSMNKALRAVSLDLRNARQVVSQGNQELRFTQDGSTYFVYYLFSKSDSYSLSKSDSYPFSKSDAYPLKVDGALCQLRKATLSGGMDGNFQYGSGELVAKGILPPPVSSLSFQSPVVTIDLTAQQGRDPLRLVRTIRPRNL